MKIEKMKKSKKKVERLANVHSFSLIKIILFLLGIICTGIYLIFFIEKESGYTLKRTATQYYAGNQVTILEDTSIIRNLDNKTILKENDTERELTSLVLYYEDTNSIILPSDMIYFDPRNNVTSKIDQFTEITYNRGITAKLDDKQVSLNPGFLYDGDNYFVFLEETDVKFNGFLLSISPLSYIEAVYKNQLMIFDYETKETTMDSLSSEIIANVPSQDYMFELLNGTLTLHDGTKSLLFTRADLLESIFD